MAKQSKSKPVEVYYHNSSLQRLLLSSKFIYEVELYKYWSGGFALEDSKIIESTKHAVDEQEVMIKDGIRYKRCTTLIGAPEKWLTSNKFTKT